MTTILDISANSLTLRAIKRPLPVNVYFAQADGICQTLEGPVAYRKDDAILTGVAGENWPVERVKFDERYEPSEGVARGNNGNYVKKSMVVFALHLDAPVDVKMPGGGTLHGMPSDWLLQYAQEDYGIVKDEIFRATYDLMK